MPRSRKDKTLKRKKMKETKYLGRMNELLIICQTLFIPYVIDPDVKNRCLANNFENSLLSTFGFRRFGIRRFVF